MAYSKSNHNIQILKLQLKNTSINNKIMEIIDVRNNAAFHRFLELSRPADPASHALRDLGKDVKDGTNLTSVGMMF